MNELPNSYPKELVLVRHGESEMNVRRAIALHRGDATDRLAHGLRDMDVPLTIHGHEQSAVTGRALMKEFGQFDAAYVSPHLRARQTFEAMTAIWDYHLPVNSEDRVREKEFGIISQYTNQGIRKHFPQEAERLEVNGAYYYRPLGGESYPDIGLRLHSFLHSLYSHQAGKKVLVVSHAAVIAMMRKLLEKFDEQTLLDLDGLSHGAHEVANCGVTYYRYDPEQNYLKLIEFNKVYYDDAA
ncbi:histidine phosphatase family protein [bacterium]|nr:histidine phosphatase family protein [bacterium]